MSIRLIIFIPSPTRQVCFPIIGFTCEQIFVVFQTEKANWVCFSYSYWVCFLFLLSPCKTREQRLSIGRAIQSNRPAGNKWPPAISQKYLLLLQAMGKLSTLRNTQLFNYSRGSVEGFYLKRCKLQFSTQSQTKTIICMDLPNAKKHIKAGMDCDNNNALIWGK